MSGGEGHSEESLRRLGHRFQCLNDIKDEGDRTAVLGELVASSARKSLKFGHQPPVFTPDQHDCLVDLARVVAVSLEGARRKPQGFWQKMRRGWRETSWGVKAQIVAAIIGILAACTIPFAVLWYGERLERQRLEAQLEETDRQVSPVSTPSSPPRVSMPRTVVAE
ncbi:MAG: hypothetical protein LPL00_02440 [Alphaproteobacteria bacterium]|nr:hypothetical protein [Alphaproteobacteria bacterium]MDX5463092.1 hypothetical protein [Alphaproteobacteria bacterium]